MAAETNRSTIDFGPVWEPVDATNDPDVSTDDYPVWRAPDRANQLGVRS